MRRAVSWQATAWAVKQRTGNPALKLLLLTLANYADDEGCCWPSQKTLSEDTEQSADSVQRKLKQLEASGLIRKVVRLGKQGRWSSRTYFLDMGVAEKSKPQSAARPDDEPCRNEPSTMPQNRDDHAATGTVTMPHSSAALTVIEPSIEPSEGENRARAKRLPHDFGLDRETQEWAVHRLGSAEAVYASMFKFEHHHRSKGSQYVDWMARAHLWIEDDARKATKEAVNDKSVVAAAKRLNEKIRRSTPSLRSPSSRGMESSVCSSKLAGGLGMLTFAVTRRRRPIAARPSISLQNMDWRRLQHDPQVSNLRRRCSPPWWRRYCSVGSQPDRCRRVSRRQPRLARW